MSIQYPDLAALVLRVGFGLYMLLGHGISKLKLLMEGVEIPAFGIFGLPPIFVLGLAVFAEFIACLFIIIGYKTRLAALPIIITMLVAAFIIHSGDSFFMHGAEKSKEPALIYFIGFLSIYLLGSGKYSVDDKMDGIIS